MKPMLETLNQENCENPLLIKIGSTLNPLEMQDLKELPIEYQEVFAWSHEDMFGIDPDTLFLHSL